MKYEIYMRIQDDLQDVKEHDLMNEDFVMLLKTILVGGFYSKCVEVVK